jgi:dTDP-4-dehydrorhamnose 3,5-epimerase
VIFQSLPLHGAHLIALEPRRDARGMFARAFCAQEFDDHGLQSHFVQGNLSTNVRRGTVRGMHYQRSPDAEVKVVRCVRGALFDVIVDLREDSPTYRRWYGAELSEENGLMMYVPQGFAHGLQALTDGATAFYLVSAPYAPAAEGGCRYNDPSIGIHWPLAAVEVSEKDAAWPMLQVAG